MVWAEQIGVSLVVPSDHVQGDGRNYIVIGEDIPTEVASAFTAALVFHNGGFNGADPGNMFPNGFVYWVIGISKNGALEIVAFYYTVSAPSSAGAFSYYRQTVLSAAPPIGADNLPVLSLGYNPNYATYGEGTARLLMNYAVAMLRQTVASGTYQAGWGDIVHNVADVDTKNGYVPGNSYYTVQEPGNYELVGTVQFTLLSPGNICTSRMIHNGGIIPGSLGDYVTVAGSVVQRATSKTATVIIPLKAGDTILLQGYANALWGTYVGPDGQACVLSIKRVG